MEHDDLQREFISECIEALETFEQHLLRLESSPGDADLIALLFRAMHSIKGASGFLGFARLERLSHACESVLGAIRDRRLEPTSAIITQLLGARDTLRTIVEHARAGGGEPEIDTAARAQALDRLLDSASGSMPAPVAAEGGTHEELAAAGEDSVRVDVQLLDKLMNLVGELVLARNQIAQITTRCEGGGLQGATQRLNLITTELQEGVMKTRMQAISNVWGRLPRIARDVSLECGRRVRLDLAGGDTELDRTLLDALKDPLVHLLRNAIDHGIEAPEDRERLGKHAEGVVSLRAFHEGGHVIIEMSDDGRGIDVAAVRQRAVERGLATAERAERMDEREAIDLIFLAGFSTAQRVSRISGRGVGLDVVRANIERIGGTVDVESRGGAGTTFRIKIPLTLAIIPALIVDCAGDRFAIPQANLLELVRVDQGTGIERIRDTLVFRLRGSLLPLVDLPRELRLREAASSDAGYIVVVQADDRPFGLIVDALSDTEEIVVKPLGRQLQGIGAFAGATILGDGMVALIVDVAGLAKRSDVHAGTRERRARVAPAAQASVETGELMSVLVFTVSGQGRCAVPLGQIARLEEITASRVERLGSQPVVQYRGSLMPLIHIGAALGRASPEMSGSLQVVVQEVESRRVGLVVDEIHDVVEERLAVERRGGETSGVIGWAVVQGKATQLLDAAALVARLLPEAATTVVER